MVEYIWDKIFWSLVAEKTALICDVMNIDREDFVKTKLTEGYLKFVGKYMHRWLQDNPQEDENGKPMEMGLLLKVKCLNI